MSLVSFSKEFHSLMASHTGEESPKLGRTIQRAEEIIRASNTETLSGEKAIEAMTKVSKCFKDFPELRALIKEIIIGEKQDLEEVREPAAKRRRKNSYATSTAIEEDSSQNEPSQAATRKRAREAGLDESVQPSKKRAIDPWVEDQTSFLLMKILKRRASHCPKGEESSFIKSYTEGVLTDFVTKCKSEKGRLGSEIDAVKSRVMARIDSDLDLFHNIPEERFKKISFEYLTIEDVLSCANCLQWAEEHCPTLVDGKISLFVLFQLRRIYGVDTKGLLKRATKFPDIITIKMLLYVGDKISFSEFKCEYNQVMTTGVEDGEIIKQIMTDLLAEKKERQEERSLLVKKLRKEIPLIKKTTLLEWADNEFLKNILDAFNSGILPIPKKFPAEWKFFYLHMANCERFRLSYSPHSLGESARIVLNLVNELRGLGCDEEELENTVDTCLVDVDASKELLQFIRMLPTEEKERIKNSDHKVDLLKFMQRGGTVDLYNELETAFILGGYFDACSSVSAKSITMLKAFRPDDWKLFQSFVGSGRLSEFANFFLEDHRFQEPRFDEKKLEKAFSLFLDSSAKEFLERLVKKDWSFSRDCPSCYVVDKVVRYLNSTNPRVGSVSEEDINAVKSILTLDELLKLASAFPYLSDLVNELRELNCSDEEINGTITESVGTLKELCQVLRSLPPEERELVKNSDNKLKLLRFLECGGTIDLHKHLHAIDKDLNALNFLSAKSISMLKMFNNEDWELFKTIVLDNRFNSCNDTSSLELTVSLLSECFAKEFLTRLVKKDFAINRWFPSISTINTIVKFFESPDQRTCLIHERFFTAIHEILTPQEWVKLISAIPSLAESRAFFYLAEKRGYDFFIQVISARPLADVSTEPLLRALSSKPFSQIKVWLEECIPSTTTRRIDSLTQQQKESILKHFRRYDSNLPTKNWMDILSVSEEEARVICTPKKLPPLPSDDDVQRLEQLLRKDFDPNNPVQFLSRLWQVCMTDKNNLLGMLLTAKIEPICDDREFLTWADCSTDSICAAQNSIPLYARCDGNPVTLYPRNVFGDFQFPVPFVTLYRQLIETYVLHGALSNDDLGEELLRVIDYASAAVQQVHPKMELELPPCTLDPNTLEGKLELLHKDLYKKQYKAKEFLPQLKRIYNELIASMEGNTPAGRYDRDHFYHRIIFSFMAFLLLTRSATCSSSGNSTDIAFSPDVFFHIIAAPPGKYEVRVEDNPSVDNEDPEQAQLNLEKMKSEYPLHTLSPLTPNRSFPPSMFLQFMKEVQVLDAKEFYSLVASCLSLVTNDLDEYKTPTDVYNEWQAKYPKEVRFSREAKAVLCELVTNYRSIIEKSTAPLSKNATIIFDPTGADTYAKESSVPKFVRCEGNYASALCCSYTIHDTLLHEGSCGINALLSSLYGPDKYAGPDGETIVLDEVSEFRKNIVEYAVKNRDALVAKHGEKDVDRFIRLFNDSTGSDWSSYLTWECAASVYGREIRVFSRGDTSQFSLDEEGKVLPAETFTPVGAVTGPPINIMLYGVHYCTLIPKV